MGKIFSERTQKILTILVDSGKMKQMSEESDEDTSYYIIFELFEFILISERKREKYK